MILTTFFSGMVSYGRLGLAMVKLPTKFEVPNFYPLWRYERHCKRYKMWWFGMVGSLKVIGNVTVRSSTYNFLFVFNKKYASVL